MKVICISHDDPNGWPLDPGKDPDIGDICTVVATVEGIGRDNSIVPCYILKEFSNGWVYPVKCFAPLSDIDEKEFQREYNKELV